jgi:hypothetical protein
MPSLDPTALVNSITQAASGILKKDVTQLKGFSQSQLDQLAAQAQGIVEMQLAGVFDGNEDLRKHFVTQLEDMTRNFVKVMRGLAMVTAEKLWNSVVDTIWKAIGTATGVALPLPVGGLKGVAGLAGLAGTVVDTLKT